MYTITKAFRFEAAHRLAKDYVGKCSNIHGHSYRVTIDLGTYDLDKYSMVKDFGDLHPIKDWLDENFDHAVLLYHGDREVVDFCNRMKFKTFVFDENPTAEIIAETVFAIIRGDVHLRDFLISVAVEETDTSMAIYSE